MNFFIRSHEFHLKAASLNERQHFEAGDLTFGQAAVAVDESDALVDDDRDALVGQLLVSQRVAAVERDRFDVLAENGALLVVAGLKKNTFHEMPRRPFNVKLKNGSVHLQSLDKI